jgi:hypothetical protein
MENSMGMPFMRKYRNGVVMKKPYQPWKPMTDSVDIRTLGKLGEESGELSQIICRSLIQGIDETDPKQNITNRVWLENEIADVFVNAQLVIERFNLDTDAIAVRMAEKEPKLRAWQGDALTEE